jgi:hypothetical protein
MDKNKCCTFVSENKEVNTELYGRIEEKSFWSHSFY